MVFPYYPRPEDDEQEPAEEQQQQDSPSYLPFYLSYIYPAPPAPDQGYVTPGVPHTLPSGPTTHPDPPIPNDIVAVVQPPTISGPGYVMPGVALDPSTETLPGDQSTGQTPSPDSGGQDSTDDAPDIVSEREFTEADVLKFCEYICEKDEAVFTQVLKILEGFEPDADEQTIRQRVNEYLRLLGLNDYFPPEVVYSAPLGATLFQGNTSNATFPDGSRNIQPVGRTDQEKSYKVPPPELNHPTQEFLTNTFPNSWNPEWTTRAELEAFLKERLVTFIPGFDLSIVPWDQLTVQGLVHYYGSLIDKVIKDNQQTVDFNTTVWITELDTELGLASQLLSRTAKAPLEDETALLESLGYKDAAQARDRLTAELSFVFETYGLQLPTDLAQWSLLELANAYHSVLTTVVQPSMHEGSEDYEKALAFIDGFEHQVPRSSGNVVSLSEQYVIDRLEGKQEEGWGPAADLFLFAASIFIEPVDWLVTGVEMADAARRGDWGSFFINGVLAALPFVSGRVDNAAKKAFGVSDEVAQANLPNVPHNQISNISELKVIRGFQRAGSDYFMAVDNYVDRTVSNYNSTNARRLNKEMERAAGLDERFAWRLKEADSDQQMHHIVPTGRLEGDEARRILSAQGVYVNSAYNGIALDQPIHQLTNSKKYTEAISEVIVELEHASPEAIVAFLEETAQRLQKLNGYKGGDKLNKLFETEILDWFAKYPET